MIYTAPEIKYCIVCGHLVENKIPEFDNCKRAVCPACHYIQYQNPRNVVGTIPIWDDRVLLCRRNIEPRKGYWTLPAGFLELGETTAEGAKRETKEEAGADFELGKLCIVMNVVVAGQVHFLYAARLLSDQFSPGSESAEVRLFSLDEIPWDELAFLTTRTGLQILANEFKSNQFGENFHNIDLNPSPVIV